MRVTDYIINKLVDRDKVNGFNNLKDVGKVAWDLISAFYKAGWDTLHMKDNISFRNKMVSKFIPKINSILKTKNSKNIEKLSLTSSLLPPIPAKLPKEVNNLNKFFKKRTNVPNYQSSQIVDLVFLYFILIFIFILIYFITFLFLEHRVRVSDGHES